ncbi:MAG: hypothetical protein ACOYMD_10435 [Paludibacter sp.]
MRNYIYCTIFFSVCLLQPAERAKAQRPVQQAVEQVHSQLWEKFIDQYGVMNDFVGETPTPEDCALGRPNAIGWWSPIENGPMFTGMYLPAICERARRSKDPADAEKARRLSRGLIKCASISDVPGFIARGVGSDGKCHYPLGSDDQTHPWFLGLHEYFMSGIPSESEKKEIALKMKEVANVLEANSWRAPCDGAFKGEFRGSYTGELFRDAARYLFILRAMYDVTKEEIWLNRYKMALAEKPVHATRTRLEICAEGYLQDSVKIKGINIWNLWIYVGSQQSLASLIKMESDPSVVAGYQKGLENNVNYCLASVEGYKTFDNNDTKVFGHAKWREAYPTWFPQPTQAEAQRLSSLGNMEKMGERKNYESRRIRNPLAGAAIAAFSQDPSHHEMIKQAIAHYDYAKINMAEFFFAECAYYALSTNAE